MRLVFDFFGGGWPGLLADSSSRLSFFLDYSSTLLDTPNSPRKSLCGSLFCALSQEMRHINFFWAPKRGVLGGGQKVYLEKVYVLFPSLIFGGSGGTLGDPPRDSFLSVWAGEGCDSSAKAEGIATF